MSRNTRGWETSDMVDMEYWHGRRGWGSINKVNRNTRGWGSKVNRKSLGSFSDNILKAWGPKCL